MSSQNGVKLPSEYNTLHLGIALYDPSNGTILDANERFEAIFGYTTEQLRDLSIDAYTANTHPPSESEFRDRLQMDAPRDPQQFMWRAKRRDGELIWVQIHLSRHQFANRTCVCAEVRDVTNYYETHHREELFWRVLRHNLRNEASIILGNANNIIVDTENDLVQRSAATIQARAENLGNTATSVKEVEQAVTDTKKQRVRRYATAAVKEVVDEVVTDYPTAEITLRERAEMGVYVDSAFTYALTHALENAIVHSDEPEPVVGVSIGPSPNTGRVEICIEDTNRVIPDNEIEALFTPMETTSTSHGTGVGLFVMKWCIESLGGEITFETREPRGNTIYFYLPPKDRPDDEESSTTSETHSN